MEGYTEYDQCNRKQKGNVFLVDVFVYEACVDLDEPEALLLTVRSSEQQGGSGVTYSDEAGFTDIQSAASVIPEARLYSGRTIKYTVAVQSGAMNKIYEELDYGLTYQFDPDRSGWEYLVLTDQVGKQVKRFSVKIVFTDNGVTFLEHWIPAAELMVNNRKALAAGQLAGVNLDIMAQTYNDNGDRVKAMRPVGGSR